MAKKENDLIIYHKITNLLIFSKNLLKKYPKSERFDLCTDIKNCIYDSLKLVMFALKTQDSDKRFEYLQQVDVNLYFLKSLVRMSYEYKYITAQNYKSWNVNIDEIGKMIGGWLKNVKKSKQYF